MSESWVQDDFPLTLRHVLERMRGMYGNAEVVTQRERGRTRVANAEVGRRVDRLTGALRELGDSRHCAIMPFGRSASSQGAGSNGVRPRAEGRRIGSEPVPDTTIHGRHMVWSERSSGVIVRNRTAARNAVAIGTSGRSGVDE